MSSNYIILSLLAFVASCNAAGPVVSVAQGSLQGAEVQLVTKDGTCLSFKGIPYAAPPVGALRFKAPLPPLAWNGTRDATQHGSKCPQLDLLKGVVLKDEDCLFLNVYTQDLAPKTPKAVMVYFHGGGFRFGSANTEDLGPDFLVSHDVVVVTVNYRLDVFGFLCMDTKDVPGNAALKDQVAALRWVKANIKNFGGDPDNVTIFGQSTGGASVVFHAMSDLSKGLFNRVISMSGTPLNDWALPYEPKRRAFSLGDRLGLHTTDPDELLKFLQSLPVEKLVSLPSKVLSSEETGENFIKQFPFTAVVENDVGQDQVFLDDYFKELIVEGKIQGVDMMIGTTSKEAIYAISEILRVAPTYSNFAEIIVPKQIIQQKNANAILDKADKIKQFYFGDKDIDNSTVKEFVNYASDIIFSYGVQTFANILPEITGRNKYFYQFSALTDRSVYGNSGAKYGVVGASHLDDLLYLFNVERLNQTIDKASDAYKVVDTFCKLFTNFARTGNPTPDTSLGVTWPTYDSTSKKYLDIGNTLKVASDLNPNMVKFWDDIYSDVV